MTAAPSRILLVGLMGAGKSSVGRALAEARGIPYLDNDTLVAAHAGSAKEALLQSQGLSGFHRIEAAIALELIGREGTFVGALPASAALNVVVREALAQRGPDLRIVWLRASLDTLADRLARDPSGRPFLALHPPGAPAPLAPPRETAYQALADITVDVDGRTPEAIASEIEAALGRR